MQRYIAVDIETLPNMDVVDLLPPPKIPANYKSEEAIAKATVAGRQKQIEKMGLSPLWGKIACLGWTDGVESNCVFGESTSLDEWQKIIKMLPNSIISFNGKTFDIPFIYKRGIINQHHSYTLKNMMPYIHRTTSLHIDLMQEFSTEYRDYESLDTLSKILLGKPKGEYDYRKISDDIKTEEGRKLISEYCLEDCDLIFKLGRRLGYY